MKDLKQMMSNPGYKYCACCGDKEGLTPIYIKNEFDDMEIPLFTIYV